MTIMTRQPGTITMRLALDKSSRERFVGGEYRMVRIALRCDAASKWEERNPILLLGEPGVALDTRVVKLGDGVRPWNELPICQSVQELLGL